MIKIVNWIIRLLVFHSLYDSYTADIKFKYYENETSFYYVTRLEKRRDIVTKYKLHDITDDICIYRFLAY